MNWAGLSVAFGLVVVAATAGPVGWAVLAAVVWTVWR
jgi:hypothetical protein